MIRVAAVVVAATSVAAAHAASVTSVAWDRHPSGHTAITLIFDRPPAPDSFRAYPLAGPPRIVIVVTGITGAPEARVLEVSNGVVERIRLGVHLDRKPGEVHAVLDLASDRVALHSLDLDGSRLTALVGPGRGPTVTPRLRARPTATPTPDSSPSPTVIVAAPSPEPSRTPAAAPNPVASTPSEAVASSAEAPPIRPASRVVELTATDRGDGSTLLLVTADGRLPLGCARMLEVSADPPRTVVSLRGLSAPDMPRSIDLDGPNLRRVRLIHDAQTESGELHLVVHLTGPDVAVLDQRQVGPNLVLRFGVPESATARP
jgi:hypothetical protein